MSVYERQQLTNTIASFQFSAKSFSYLRFVRWTNLSRLDATASVSETLGTIIKKNVP